MRHYLHNSLRALFMSLALLLSLPMLALEVEIDGMKFDLETIEKQATVIAKSSGEYSGEVVIPESVVYEGTVYSVTGIVGAFSGCSGLTSVTIPNSVTSIVGVFSGCSGLTSVTIPNSVTSIGEYAFDYCRALTSVHISDIAVWCKIEFKNERANPLSFAHHLYLNDEEVKELVIPNGVTSIMEFAFSYCYALTSVTIPNSVTSIGERAFIGCSGLKSVTIPNSVTSIGGYAFCICSGLTSVTIGNSVTSIGAWAFKGCSGLTSVTIGNSVESIGDVAFSDCYALTSVTIPNSVTSIGNSAFACCSALTSVTIPNSVTSIGDCAFADCSGLTSIVVESGNSVYDSRNNCNAIIETATNTLHSGCQTTLIPNSVTSIGDYAFYGCSGLTSVTIPNSVTSIGDYAFYGCSGLTSVTIPNSVTSIGVGAFWFCSGLTSVTIPNSVTSIGYCAFCACDGLTSVTIPNSVTSIEEGAFYSCGSLASVTIGSGVQFIGIEAFGKCPNLLDVYCYAEKVPSTESDAFSGSYPEYATLHVPAASIDSYKATEPWSWFGKIVAITEYATGIDELKGENGKVKTALYDLSGRRVQKAQKGIFIQNGKVMVK